jgi:hypothetical protein
MNQRVMHVLFTNLVKLGVTIYREESAALPPRDQRQHAQFPE